MSTPRLSIKAITQQTLPEYRQLLSCPPEGWCWCVAWEVDSWDGWAARSADENRRLREELWAEGKFFGYLFYIGDEPCGWVRVGQAAHWPKLVRSRQISDPEHSHAITCVNLKPEYRKKGYLKPLLALVIDDLQQQGVKTLLAFPKTLKGVTDDGAIWNGPKSVFTQLGFSLTRTEPDYQEMRLCLQ